MNLNDTAGCFNDYLSIEDNGYEIERFCGRPSNEYAFLSRPGFTKQHSLGPLQGSRSNSPTTVCGSQFGMEIPKLVQTVFF